MDDLLHFSGNVQKLIIETAPVQKGTFSDKEGKKRTLYNIEFLDDGLISSKTTPDKIEKFIYDNGQLLCKHVTRPDGTLLYKDDYFYNDESVTKKIRVNSDGIVEDEESYYYNIDGILEKKQTKTMTYEYLYSDGLLIEERWHSDFNLNQIIEYSYSNNLLIKITHLSGEGIPGRRIEYKRLKSGFISDEIIYSASNMVVSHFKYEYVTIYKNNWLKRVKYLLHSQNKRKEASEVQYRDFKFYESKEDILDSTSLTESTNENETEETIEKTAEELKFDNGTYNGDVVDGEMHGWGCFTFISGTIYEGSFKNNVMEGKGKLTYKNGKIYEGTFSNNALEGPGACKWSNGDFYVGEFKNGKMHGRGCYIWENGNRFEGIFDNNKRTEQGILYKRSELESDAPPNWVNELFK